MLNQCVLTGNLGADPEVFYNPEGNPVTSFNIAFHSSKKKPKIGGLETLSRIRENERTKKIPVVVLTSSDKCRTESYKLGVASYIIKPFDFDQFSETIAAIGLYWTALKEHPY